MSTNRRTVKPSASKSESKKKNTAFAPATEVGKAVEKALIIASSTGLGGLKVKQALLTLETGSVKEGGVTLNFIIFTISHKRNKGKTITTTLTFGKAAPTKAITKSNELTESLSRAIVIAAETAAEVKTLPLSEATLKIEFAVEMSSGGGLSFKILGFDIGGDIDFNKVSKNSLELSFT